MSTTLEPDQARMAVAFRQAASYPSASKAGKLLRAPLRSVAVKAGTVLGARTGLSVPVRIRTFWGASMTVRIPEAVSNQLYCCGLFEPGMTAYLLRVLAKGQTFLDVGAHYGYFTLLAARLVGPEGRVEAFEPTPSTFQVLVGNVAALPNVSANPLAVWSEPGELTVNDLGTRLAAYNSVYAPRLGGAGPARADQVRVAAVSLDDFCAERALRPHVVKIDAESAEHRILRGMRRLLAEDRPFVTLEVGDFDIPGVPDSSSLLGELVGNDYQPFEYADGAIRPHRVRAAYGYDNLLFAPREHPLVDSLSTP